MINYRIVKQHDNGILEVTNIPFKSHEDAAKFVAKVNAAIRHTFKIIDYGPALFSKHKEIIENPTDGYLGNIKNDYIMGEKR